jgi:outer membrane protein assembly factor BamB
MAVWTCPRGRTWIAALAVAVFVSAAHAQTPPLWRETLSAKAVAFDFTPFGSVVVQLKSGLFAVDPETGKHIWSRPDVTEHTIVSETPFAIVTTAAGQAVIDLESGQDRWKLASLGFSSVKGFVHLQPADLLLVYGEAPESAHMLIAARYKSGEIVWKQAALYATADLLPKARKIQYGAHILDTDRTVVLDPTNDGLIRLDLRSGELLWRIPENALDSGGDPLAMFIADGRIFGSHGRRLLAVSADEGKVIWTRKEKFPSAVAQLASTPEGLLVRGGGTVDTRGEASGEPYLALLDPATGTTKWTTEKTKFHGRSFFLVEDNAVVIALKEGVATYDLASGKTLSSTTLPKFSGNEDPCCLERFEGGRLLMWSSQNLRMLDSAGNPIYSIYFKAPGASFMAKLATVAVQAAVAGAVGAATSSPVLYVPSSPIMTAKYKATIDARRFTYVFTESPGQGSTKFALVRIDKETGKETGRLWFAERSPSYRLDPASGIAVVIEDDGLFAIRFPPPAS